MKKIDKRWLNESITYTKKRKHTLTLFLCNEHICRLPPSKYLFPSLLSFLVAKAIIKGNAICVNKIGEGKVLSFVLAKDRYLQQRQQK